MICALAGARRWCGRLWLSRPRAPTMRAHGGISAVRAGPASHDRRKQHRPLPLSAAGAAKWPVQQEHPGHICHAQPRPTNPGLPQYWHVRVPPGVDTTGCSSYCCTRCLSPTGPFEVTVIRRSGELPAIFNTHVPRVKNQLERACSRADAMRAQPAWNSPRQTRPGRSANARDSQCGSESQAPRTALWLRLHPPGHPSVGMLNPADARGQAAVNPAFCRQSTIPWKLRRVDASGVPPPCQCVSRLTACE